MMTHITDERYPALGWNGPKRWLWGYPASEAGDWNVRTRKNPETTNKKGEKYKNIVVKRNQCYRISSGTGLKIFQVIVK